jgi:hypothetical protein
VGPRVIVAGALGVGGALLFPGGPVGLAIGLAVGGILDGAFTLFAPKAPASIAEKITLQNAEDVYTPATVALTLI